MSRLYVDDNGGENTVNRSWNADDTAPDQAGTGIQSPMEGHSSYRGRDWSPERLLLHQNLESFAERVGLIVAMQGSGKMSQDHALQAIKRLWRELKTSRQSIERL